MKKLTALFLGLICAFSLSSCGEKAVDNDPKKSNAVATENSEYIDVMFTSDYKSQWNDEYNTSQADMYYSTLLLSDDMKNIYPELAKTLEQETQDRKTLADKDFNELCEMALEQLELSGVKSFNPYEYNESIYVRRADSHIFSLLFYNSSYTGGAHENYAYYAKNYNAKTGELLAFSDVVTDMDLFAKAVEDELSLRYSKNIDYKEYLGDDISGYNLWLIDYNGITVFFNPYAIASFAEGALFVTIPYEGNESFIDSKYAEVPETYITQIPHTVPIYSDFDGDSTVDELIFYTIDNYYEEGYSTYSFSINGKTLEPKEIYAFGHSAILVHTPDGNNYIYVFTSGLNGYDEVSVYKLTGSDISYVDSIGGGYFCKFSDFESNCFVTTDITNPTNFILENRTDVLGTVFGYDTYYVGENGMPVKNSEWFYISDVNNDDETYTFNIKTDVEGEIVDKNTGELTGKKKVLSTGETVVYYRTDNISKADLITEAGEIVRFTVDEHTIDGIDIIDIFDEVLWAG